MENGENKSSDSGLEWPNLVGAQKDPREKPGTKRKYKTPPKPEPKPEEPKIILPSDKLRVHQDAYDTDHYAEGVNPFDPKTSRTSRGSQ